MYVLYTENTVTDTHYSQACDTQFEQPVPRGLNKALNFRESYWMRLQTPKENLRVQLPKRWDCINPNKDINPSKFAAILLFIIYMKRRNEIC